MGLLRWLFGVEDEEECDDMEDIKDMLKDIRRMTRRVSGDSRDTEILAEAVDRLTRVVDVLVDRIQEEDDE